MRTTKTLDTNQVQVIQDQIIPVVDGSHSDVARHQYSLAEMEAASNTARAQGKPNKK